jgi:hypothetical protein
MALFHFHIRHEQGLVRDDEPWIYQTCPLCSPKPSAAHASSLLMRLL